MRIDIISAVPKLFESFFDQSIVHRAQEKGLCKIVLHDLRDYTTDNYKSIDDYQYGGGAGMVLKIEPIFKCLEKLKSERSYDEIIYMTPDAEILKQTTLNHLSTVQNIIILCGHYKGVDQRVRDLYITKEISIGDFVLSGGEIPAAVLADGIARLIPGVLSDETSALTDSFQDNLLSPPVFTRPEIFNETAVPKVLLSGNQKEIDNWRYDKAIERTEKLRPGLIKD
ncbi:tRNA (guanosine(37)-N1)-methyltransferase TrmD [bacterium]|nr:tRNA (guanosine(37)-N1)-methyltransferase TrmD [bacterium]NQY67147.1 tRNA (guanosine(37)-N1)-methyltransferase TrmD [Flavobacteriales bacterium]